MEGAKVKKGVIGIIGAVLMAIFLLERMEKIGFGLGEVIARLWPLIFLWLGYVYTQRKERRSEKTALVFVLFGGFWFILNIAILFTENQEFVVVIAGLALVLFFPILLVMLFFHIIFSVISKGETVYSSFFMPRVLTGSDWPREDATFVSILSGITLKISPADIQFRTIRLDALTLLGKVTILVPDGVTIVAESKTRLGFFDVLGQRNKSIIGRQTVEELVIGEDRPRLLLTSSSWLGKFQVKRVS